jgi:hypothetical protein
MFDLAEISSYDEGSILMLVLQDSMKSNQVTAAEKTLRNDQQDKCESNKI